MKMNMLKNVFVKKIKMLTKGIHTKEKYEYCNTSFFSDIAGLKQVIFKF